MEILNENQVKDLINDLLENSTDEQILGVWREHFPENVNEVLLKPFRIISNKLYWKWLEKDCKYISDNRNEPNSLLRKLSQLFFSLYEFNSTELDKMQDFVDRWLNEEVDDPGDLGDEVRYLVSIMSPDNLKEYLKRFDTLRCIECDGDCFFFEESDFLD